VEAQIGASGSTASRSTNESREKTCSALGRESGIQACLSTTTLHQAQASELKTEQEAHKEHILLQIPAHTLHRGEKIDRAWGGEQNHELKSETGNPRGQTCCSGNTTPQRALPRAGIEPVFPLQSENQHRVLTSRTHKARMMNRKSQLKSTERVDLLPHRTLQERLSRRQRLWIRWFVN
jgi:hypothetical protein